MRNGGPEAARLQAGVLAVVVQHPDDAGRALVARRLQAELLGHVGVGAAGDGDGPGVRRVGQQPAERDDHRATRFASRLDDRRAVGLPAVLRLDPEKHEQVALGARQRCPCGVGSLAIRSGAACRPRARRGAGPPGSRRTPPGRSRTAALRPGARAGTRPPALPPGRRRSSLGRRTPARGCAARGGRSRRGCSRGSISTLCRRSPRAIRLPWAAVPRADSTGVVLQLADPEGRLTAVELLCDRALTREPRAFARNGAGWTLRLARPPVARFEYLLRLHGADGGSETICDPDNAERAPGAFGEKSVVRFPDYVPPAWLGAHGVAGETRDVSVACPGLGGVQARIWSPAGSDRAAPLPLVVAHDGPEYDSLSRLGHFVAASIAAGGVPPLRLALLAPGTRDQWYSASPVYARELWAHPAGARRGGCGRRPPRRDGHEPRCARDAARTAHLPVRLRRVVPAIGSFFAPEHDAHESGFVRYLRLVRAVQHILRNDPPGRPVPVALTCGAAEENAANNHLMARALSEQGYEVSIEVVPDLHNFTAWRDAFAPSLPGLIRRAWA